MEWVFDAAITMTWCFPEERTAATDALLDRFADWPAVVPQIWPLEIADMLAMAVRRKRITAAKRAEFLLVLASLPMQIDHLTATQALGPILAAADKYGLTSYDAAYLELAMRRGVPLATLDAGLRTAARKAGVMLL